MKQTLSFLTIAYLLLPVLAKAQSDSLSSKDPVQFKLGVFYNSYLNYYGRTDSLHSSGFFPLGELQINRHLYINAAPVFINNNNSTMQYAGTLATAGYRFSEDHKFNGQVYFARPFYKKSSQLVQAALKGQLAGTFTRLTRIINLTIGADIKWSDNMDYGMNAGLDHIFRFELPGQSVLVIDPSVYLYAGTQQFTRSYYKQSNFILLPGTEQLLTENVSSFNILSYEMSVPVIYGKGKWQLLFIPAYVVPQNLVIIAGRPDLSERGRKMLYATMGAKFVL